MTKKDGLTEEVAVAQDSAASNDGSEKEFALTLEEFCTRLSAGDKRVELIGAFAHTEAVAGRTKDTETAYAARYADFINKPV